MEDPSRKLGEPPRVKGEGLMDKARGCWTVLLINDLGKTLSFHLSKPLCFALIAGLTAVLTVVIYLGLSFTSIVLENRKLRKDLDSRMVELERTKADGEKALVQLMLLQEGSKQTEKDTDSTADRRSEDVAPKVENSGGGADESSDVEDSVQPEPPAPTAHPVEPEKQEPPASVSEAKVSVENLEIWREQGDNTLRFQFVVKNANPESGKVVGYTFLVLTPHEGTINVPLRVFPQTRLEDGKPANFKAGQYFSISRYKFVPGTLTGVNMINRYGTATIYAYSATGDLLVDKLFEINEVFRS
jgi:hypothetical protein